MKKSMPRLQFVTVSANAENISQYLEIAKAVKTSTNLVATNEKEALDIIAGHYTYFLFFGDKPIGLMAYVIKPDDVGTYAYLAEFGIKPEFQDKDLGSEALEYLAGQLYQQGVRRCIVIVHPNDTNGYKLYRKNGFQKTGRAMEHKELVGVMWPELAQTLARGK